MLEIASFERATSWRFKYRSFEKWFSLKIRLAVRGMKKLTSKFTLFDDVYGVRTTSWQTESLVSLIIYITKYKYVCTKCYKITCSIVKKNVYPTILNKHLLSFLSFFVFFSEHDNRVRSNKRGKCLLRSSVQSVPRFVLRYNFPKVIRHEMRKYIGQDGSEGGERKRAPVGVFLPGNPIGTHESTLRCRSSTRTLGERLSSGITKVTAGEYLTSR